MTHFYLQLDFTVLYDPALRSMRAAWRCAVLDMLAFAVRSEEPGAITITHPQLAKLLGFRKMEVFEQFVTMLEDRRVIGFRKEDDAIIVSSKYLPQLKDTSPDFPRRRKPSETSQATAERQRRSRQQRQGSLELTEDTPEMAADSGELSPEMSTEMSSKTADVTPLSHPPIELTESPMSRPLIQQQEQNELITHNNNSETCDEERDSDVVVVAFASQSNFQSVLERLVEAGVTKTNAAKLIREFGEEKCALQVDCIGYRKCNDKPAALVSAIKGDWAPPQDYEKSRVEREKREKARKASAEAQKAVQERRDADRKRLAEISAWEKSISDEERSAWTDCLVQGMSSSMARDRWRRNPEDKMALAEMDKQRLAQFRPPPAPPQAEGSSGTAAAV